MRFLPFRNIDSGCALGNMRKLEPTVEQRRAANLRAMKSSASFVLGAACIALLFCATIFYDRPITDNPVVFSYLRSVANTIQ
jgi:hypothetical protein